MDIGKALGFVFEDEEWVVKLLLGAVITLIPIFGQFALMGYAIAVIRNVKADSPQPLPAWDNLGEYFTDGLKFWVAVLVYMLPVMILICPIMLIGVLPVLGGQNEDVVTILAGISGFMSMGLSCLIVLYSILLAPVMTVVQIRYAETGEIGPCLRLGEIFRFLFANIGGIIIALALVLAVGVLVVPIVGALTLGLLALPATVWLTVFSSHLYGQIGRQAVPDSI